MYLSVSELFHHSPDMPEAEVVDCYHHHTDRMVVLYHWTVAMVVIRLIQEVDLHEVELQVVDLQVVDYQVE